MIKDDSGLSGKIRLGILWSGISLLIRKGLGSFIGLLLARFLVPDDYGLVGMAFVFTRFASVIGRAGMGDALIQMKGEKLRIEHYHTVFWSGFAWSILLFAFIYFIVTPFAASFYEEEALLYLLPLLSIPLVFSTYGAVARAYLVRNFDFKSLALVDNITTALTGVVAILLALSGWGVWALVFYSILPVFVSVPLFFYRSNYIPALTFEREAFADIFGFGSKTLGTNIANTFIGQLDYLVVSKMVSKYALGIYTFAFSLTDVVRAQIMSVINSVMFPGYSKLQDDHSALRKMYRNVVRYNAIAIYPVLGILLVFSGDLIPFFFGDKWIDSIPLVQILCLASCAHMLVNSNTTLIRGMGHVGLEFKLQLFKGVVVFAPVLIYLVHTYDATGAAYAVLINRMVAVPIAYVVLYRLLKINFLDILKDVSGAIVGFLSMVLVGYLLKSYLPYGGVLIGIAAAGLTYITICLFFYREDAARLKGMIQNRYANK